MRFKVTLKSQTDGETVDVEVSSSYDATSVVEKMARETRRSPENWDAIKCVRIEEPAPDHVEYIAGARLRHIDGSEATVNKTVTASEYTVSVETDAGLDELWPRDEIAGFGVLKQADTPAIDPSELTDAGRAHIANMEAEADEERDETERHEEIAKQTALGYDETDATERAKIICDAKGIDAQAVERDLSGPGKFEGIAEKDRPFAAALLVIANNGDADHDYEDGSSRVGWHIVGEDENGFVWYGQEDRDEADEHEAKDAREELTEQEAEKRFDDHLSEAYETVEICGLTMEQGRILKECDNIAYREAFNNWIDAEDIEIV